MQIRILFFLFLVLHCAVIGQVAKNVELLDQWQDDNLLTTSSEVRYNDCWGYAQNGEEYAMIGSTEGVHFFQIKNKQLLYVDSVRGNYADAQVIHRDIKTFENYAYLVCDQGPSKLQIVDLSYLPDSVHVVAALSTNFGRVHNLFIDPEMELLYACSVTPIVGGNPSGFASMRVFSLQDPKLPNLVYEGPNDVVAVHDCYARNGIAYLNCGYDGLRVYDFSSPSSPLSLQNLDFYQDQGYNHQGWMTPNGKTYIFGDETSGLRLKKATVAANHTIEIDNYFGTNYEEGTVPHNVMLTDTFAFVAYYNEGLRIYDIRHYAKEIAHYDTYPTEHSFKMFGAWGVYSMLPSEQLLVSDRNNGLFLFDFDREKAAFQPSSDVHLFPNPTLKGAAVTIQLNRDILSPFSIEVFDINGKKLLEKSYYNTTFGTFLAPRSAGIYFVKIDYTESDGISVTKQEKLLVIN